MSDTRQFKTAWDVAKWIEANVDWHGQGHRDPMDAALWWHSAQRAKSIEDFNGRELIEMFKDGVSPSRPDDITNDISARLEDLEHDPQDLTSEHYEQVYEQIEEELRDFWFALRGER